MKRAILTNVRDRAALISVGIVACVGLASPMMSRAALPAAQSDATCGVLDAITFGSVSVATPRAVASPIGSPSELQASPVAENEVLGADRAYIDTLVRAVTDCQTERRPKTLTKLVTDRFLGDYYAGGGRLNAETFVELAKDFPRLSLEVRSVRDISIDSEDRTATATVEVVVGRQLVRATWSFVFQADASGGTGHWLVDGVRAKTVSAPAGADEVNLTLDEYEFRPGGLRADGPDVVINARNRGEEDHEVLVLALANGVTTAAILAEPGADLPRGITVLGQITVSAGETAQLILVGMDEGQYAIVDLLVDANGTPHLALGMEGTLTIR